MARDSVVRRLSETLSSIFAGYGGRPFAIRLWDGWQWTSSGAPPACTIVIHSPDALHSLIARPSEITLGGAYISNEIDVEGDLFSVFDVAEHVFQNPRGARQQVIEGANRLWHEISSRRKGPIHSLKRDSASISYHYDQPIAFYRPWLGNTLVYSCAYFQSSSDAIDTAQSNKLELICRKLRLQPGENLLDIGCGWGSLIMHAASSHKVFAQGITLSREQQSIASERIAKEGLTQRCRAELLDYRNALSHLSTFDKIASVGMFEHVGLKNLPLYFQTAYNLLKPGGVFLNHGIARLRISGDHSWSLLDTPLMRSISHLSPLRQLTKSSFIDKYVFPDGELVPISQALEIAESAGFEVRDVENLREHYELTLRCWYRSLCSNAEYLLQQVSATTYRIWLLYIAGSAAAFRRGDIGVYQTLLSRPKAGKSHLPLTRDDWYTPRLVPQEIHV